MRALERTLARLAEAGIETALIGALALAARGVARSTFDVDLLAVHADALAPQIWRPLREEGLAVEVRHGEPGDPLAGVVRIQAPGEPFVDVVVGDRAWQRAVLGRAEPMIVAGASVRVARSADLILLKLYAGGSSDRWDVQQLLASARDRAALVAEVEARLPDLPAECGPLWLRLRSEAQ